MSGAKRFIVGAEGADFFLIYAKTAPENPPDESLSVFLVERDRGVEVEHIFGLMGARGGGTGRISLRKVWVPEENMVGPLNGGALIFDQMMIPERMTSGAACIGTAQAALDVAARYSMKRKAFGRPINRFQAVSHKVAESITRLDAARGLLWATAKTMDAGLPHRRMVSETKKYLTETAWDVVNEAMQIMGGIGYTDVYPIERLLRDIRLSMIWTGTSEIMSERHPARVLRRTGRRQRWPTRYRTGRTRLRSRCRKGLRVDPIPRPGRPWRSGGWPRTHRPRSPRRGRARLPSGDVDPEGPSLWMHRGYPLLPGS